MDVMEVKDRSDTATPASTRRDRGPLAIVLVAVVALVLGALAGWGLRGSDDGSTDDVIEVVTGQLSGRQQEMLKVADDHYDAFVAGDGTAMAALYAPHGVILFHHEAGTPDALRADDGTLATMFDRQVPPGRMEMLAPVSVFDDSVVRVVDWGSGYGVLVHRFTTSGDVLIISSQYI